MEILAGSGLVIVGKALWNLLISNRPVYNSKTDFAHAIPQGVRFHSMAGWTPLPQVERFQYLHHTFGVQVAQVRCRASFKHSGSYKGAGRYIANATVAPESSKIENTFQRLDVTVRAEQPVATGVAGDPVAALSLHIDIVHKVGLRTFTKGGVFTALGNGGRDLQWA